MRTVESPEVYWLPVRERVPALLSLLDREPHSPTHGLFDRTFWCWKFTDFPASRMQEAVAALAMLRDLEAPGNTLRGAPRLLEWIEAGLLQWCALQHRDGSLDEAYPYERSLAATAFTVFYVAEAVERVGGELPAASIDAVKRGLLRAGEWLSRNDESHGFLTNHQAAAAAALVHIARLCGEARFEARARFFLEKILTRQSAEGWCEE